MACRFEMPALSSHPDALLLAAAAESLSPAGNCVKQAVASAPTLAMGRVVGSLSVLTAKDEDASSAMLASWVSQVGLCDRGSVQWRRTGGAVWPRARF